MFAAQVEAVDCGGIIYKSRSRLLIGAMPERLVHLFEGHWPEHNV